jgi:DNA-binding GntR family transcriptional regulator
MVVEKLKRPETLKYQAQEQIKMLMVTGKLEAGRVYSANHFAKVLGVSRTPTREALLELTAEGYFVSLLGRGFRIRQFTEKEIVDFFETRRLIETYVIGRIEDRLTAAFSRSLTDSLQQMVVYGKAHDEFRFLEADKAFHMLFIDLYANRQFASIMENIRNLMTIMGKRALISSGRVNEVIREHRSIIDALVKPDIPAAVRAMSNHINSTERIVLINQIRR